MRIGWDSNPRWSCDTGLTVQTFRPLKQPIHFVVQKGFEPSFATHRYEYPRYKLGSVLHSLKITWGSFMIEGQTSPCNLFVAMTEIQSAYSFNQFLSLRLDYFLLS